MQRLCLFLPTSVSIDEAEYAMLPQRTKKDAALTEAQRQPGKPAGQPALQLSRNGAVLQDLSLDLPRLLIGRSEDNDMCIPSRYVSRHHILLIRHGGSTILIDLDSTNGTFVNSTRVHTHILANDDVITIDRQSLFVQYSIKYCDPFKTSHGVLGDVESAKSAIEEALAAIGTTLGEGDTDVLPTLTENLPTVVSFIDDR